MMEDQFDERSDILVGEFLSDLFLEIIVDVTRAAVKWLVACMKTSFQDKAGGNIDKD